MFVVWDLNDIIPLGIPAKETGSLVLPLLPLLPLKWMLNNPASFQSGTEATPNQIRILRLKRFELHEAFFLLFNLPGMIKTELSRRAHETEMKAFMLQLVYQATLLSSNLVRIATKDLTLNIAEEMIAKIYERFRNPRLGTVDNWIWPFEGDNDEDKLNHHLALAISRLLHESCSADEEDEEGNDL